jgi:inositol-phosphate phosphatase / L-galactose 1-phosphate phosphatase / histidinol-phosphatase
MPDTDIAELLDAAETIAAQSTGLTMQYFRSAVDVHNKADASPVTIADRATEAAIRQAISDRYPDHGIMGEEHGAAGLDREYVWVIDPIDGTKSFISGVPLFGTLIGVLRHGRPVAGVIHMPRLGETFVGAPGRGTRFNGAAVHCRSGVAPEDAFLCYNELHKLVRHEPDRAARLLATGRYQRPTMDCYPYAQLAAGWVDGVIDYDLDPYDYLPLVGVVEGAGGIITDWNGAALGLRSDGTVAAAASPGIHAALLSALRA